ncbi:inositol monophosphatase [Tessaracoccus sp. OH4464_COT-324]|uniref:inositol monophosphatase family protein n=1 Tax=Tessaracoccus sp. OH4464_COT-324 TaxID=2491059 RepID=UPI000F6356EA|nr:inositol monophosphatase [Tessaracoccus sp. OH4464_COT-324]RRD47819.1 inositol monophosphatase [Tessaracoccus sp. OH4464_COT-324]
MDLEGIAELMRETAHRAINPRFRQLAQGDIDEKRPGDLVTVADREAENILGELLLREYPEAHVVGEESVFAGTTSLTELAAGHVFVIDPIDGTRNFVEGRKEHGVMLAEVRAGETVRGWIWQPQYERLYTVERGTGEVLLNGEPVERRARHPLPQGAAGQRRRWGYTAGGKLAPVRRSSGAACFDYPHTVTGEIDFMYYTNAHPWDHLVGCLMLAETGGVGRMLSGEDYVVGTQGRGLLVARTPEIWDLAAADWEP